MQNDTTCKIIITSVSKRLKKITDRDEADGKSEKSPPKPKVKTNLKQTESKYNFRKSLLNYGFNEDLIISWLEIRKKKKAVNSEIAFKGFIREIEKVPLMPINDILKKIIEKSWSGFDSAWIKNDNNGQQGQTNYDAIKTFGDDFLNRQNQDSGNGG
jgi:hypothetical protein